ncbi:DNA-entry nuclease [Streptococcus mitis]|uniref:DNA-entry nuclease n=1 Tax=Streptococcus mitis TaxID=28037 RepID=A0A428CU51_STRMT|nr:DNA-entry nuclease [Streptococcus mitis]RSI83505.1 DNA-entry nuclease [Streptococcus mitis]
MGYPHLHQAVYSITESVLEQLEIDDIEKLKKFYNGYGSFDLPNFVNFDTKIFEKLPNLDEFARNIEKSSRFTIGQALLSHKTIAKNTSKGKSQFKGSIFHTGHLLAYMLIGNLPETEFNSRKTNLENVVPLTPWANGRGFKLNTSYGNSQRVYEQLIKDSITESETDFRVFYQVEAIYDNDLENVPRGILLQAISNNKNHLRELHVFVPNVKYGRNNGIDYSDWKLNQELLISM